MGINAISAAIDEEKDTIESIYEPFLMKIGFLEAAYAADNIIFFGLSS